LQGTAFSQTVSRLFSSGASASEVRKSTFSAACKVEFKTHKSPVRVGLSSVGLPVGTLRRLMASGKAAGIETKEDRAQSESSASIRRWQFPQQPFFAKKR
jgi:hypothetical protein